MASNKIKHIACDTFLRFICVAITISCTVAMALLYSHANATRNAMQPAQCNISSIWVCATELRGRIQFDCCATVSVYRDDVLICADCDSNNGCEERSEFDAQKILNQNYPINSIQHCFINNDGDVQFERNSVLPIYVALTSAILFGCLTGLGILLMIINSCVDEEDASNVELKSSTITIKLA